MPGFDVEKRLEQVIATIRKADPEVRAYIEVFDVDARDRAKEVNERIAKGKAGKLAGMVVAVKNNIAIKGKRMTCSSKMLETYYAPYNATVIERLEKEDAIIIGTTNMDEFACGSDTTHSALHWTRNPRDLGRVPGGSSGGSAAAVASDMCDAAIGSDTGGSIRCPAAFCGVVGFKPTYGAVSRYGLADMAMSLDQIGPMAPDVVTAEKIFDVIKGKDKRDPITDVYEERKGKVEVIGIPKEFFDGVDPNIASATKKAIQKLEKEYEIAEVSIPSIKYAIPTYYLLMFAEFSSAMQKYDGLRYGATADRTKNLYQAFEEARGSNFGKEVKRRILLGTYITMKEFKESWYTQTLRARKIIQDEFNAVLKKCDVLAGPAMPVLPWKFGEKLDPVEIYSADILTVSANLAGLPAGVVPAGEVSGLPVAVQIHGRHFEDKSVLEVMKKLE